MESSAYQLYSSYCIGPNHQGQQPQPSPPPQFRPSVLTPPPPRASTASYYHGRHIERTPSPNVQRFTNNKKKKVTFKPTCTVRTHTEVKGPLSKDELSGLYYSRRELQIMNLEARAICTLTQELPEIQNRGTFLTEQDRRYSGTVMAASRPTLHRRGSWLGLDEEEQDDTPGTMIDTLRGLELIMYPKRKQNKLLAHRSLLKYQQLLNSKPNLSPERKVKLLAAASEKLNKWSSLVALETARLDALRAYDGDYLIPIEPLNPNGIPPCRYHKNLQEKVFDKREQNQQIKRRFGRRGSRRVTFDATDSNKNNVASLLPSQLPSSIANSANFTWDRIVEHQQQSKRRKIV